MSILMKLFENDVLLEKNRQNYFTMFSKFIETFNAELNTFPDDAFRLITREDASAKIDSFIRSQIKSAISGINRNDRATWLVLNYRPSIASSTYEMIINKIHIKFPINTPTHKVINAYVAKSLAMKNSETQLKQWLGLTRDANGNFIFSASAGNYTLSYLTSQLRHYGDLEYGPIQRYDVTNKSIDTVLSDLRSLEDRYNKEMGADDRFILISKMQDKPDVLIDFNNGFAWYDLNTGVSREEGRTMRHCCTDPRTSNNGGTVYSLRQLVKRKGKQWLKPVATFMIKDKILYEMKGFGNAKPDAKYHPYIIKLLESDYITGIVGGGYSANTNFTLNDLPEEEARRLAKMKPNLIEAEYVLDYFEEGTDEFWQYITNLTDKDTFQKLEPKLQPDTIKKIYKMKPEFLTMVEVERVFGLKSEEMKKWVLGINNEHRFAEFISFLRGHWRPPPSKRYTDSDIDYIKMMRPDLISISDNARLFGPMSEEFQNSIKNLHDSEEEEERVSIENVESMPDEAKHFIIEHKPNAITVDTYVRILGTDSPVAMKRFFEVSDQMGHGLDNIENLDDDYYWLQDQSADSLEDFIEKYGNDTAQYCLRVLKGDDRDFWDHGDYAEPPDSWEIEKWISNDDYNKLLNYIKSTFAEEIESDYSDIDIEDKRSVIDFAMENIEEFKDAVNFAASDGHRMGAENEVYSAFRNALDGSEFPITSTLSGNIMFYEQPWEDRQAGKSIDVTMKTLSTEYTFESKVWVVLPKKDILKAFLDGEFQEHWAAYGFDDLDGFHEDTEIITVDEPYNGWSGYDEEAAKERFQDTFHDQMSELFKSSE